MDTTPPSKDLQSLGHGAGQYQRSVRELKSALAGIGVKRPSLVLNTVTYFRAVDVAKAAKHLADNDAKRLAEDLARQRKPMGATR